MWVVVFTVGDPQGAPDEFLHHAAIWVRRHQRASIREVQVRGPADTG